MDEARRFRAAEHVVATQQHDTTILLDILRGKYYTLNQVGGRIWALLADGATASSVQQCLAKEFAIPPERLAADVESFMVTLDSARLISVT